MKRKIYTIAALLFVSVFTITCTKAKEETPEPFEEGLILIKLEVDHGNGNSTYSKIYTVK